MAKYTNDLASRDAAYAALMGATGDNFGTEDEVVLYTGAPAGFGGDFGDDLYDGGFADVLAGESMFGADITFGADDPSVAAAPAVAAAQHGATPQGRAIIAQHVQKQAHRNSRALLLEPNKYSDLKVERYTFAINATITALGTAGALSGSNSPDVNFRPQRVTANVVSPGMILISDGRVANVSFTVGGNIDAWQWNANAVGQHLDVPTLTPANKATFSGSYTGLVPSPLSGTGAYTFSLSFTGPASIVA